MLQRWVEMPDELAFQESLLEEIQAIERILHVLLSADATPTILQARLLYAERLVQFRSLAENVTEMAERPFRIYYS